MRTWFHKVDISVTELEIELNAFSQQGYQIYKLWKVGYDKYEIVAFKENVDRCTCGQEWVNHDNRKCEEWHKGAELIPNAYDENGNPIKIALGGH